MTLPNSNDLAERPRLKTVSPVRRFQQRDNLSLRDRLIDHRPFLNLV